jgi:predicted O-methyltransferase YrrM
MSALFILAAMKAYAKAGKLTTVEAWEPMFSISSSMLKHLHAESVSSHFGKSEQALAELAQQLDRVDFMFHDAGHLGEDYVNDFRQACDMLAPGAVVLFDDIRWEDRTVHSGATGAYRGWKEVVNHARVSQAFEIDNDLGLLLLN